MPPVAHRSVLDKRTLSGNPSAIFIERGGGNSGGTSIHLDYDKPTLQFCLNDVTKIKEIEPSFQCFCFCKPSTHKVAGAVHVYKARYRARHSNKTEWHKVQLP